MDGAYCAWMPAMRSRARGTEMRVRSSRSCRASSARFRSRAGAELTVAIVSADDRAQGLGTEGAALACGYAFDGLGLHRLTARFSIENAAAAAAMRRWGQGAGWRQMGVERGADWAFGRHV